MEKSKLTMRDLLAPFFFALVLILYPAAGVHAQQEKPADTPELREKAIHLKSLLDDLLSNPNSSSIQKIIKSGDLAVDALIDKALELKSLGETALNEKNYLKAAMHFQSSLEYVIQAIRSQKNNAEEPQKIQASLEEKRKASDTFISAATRVVEQESNVEATRLLKMAKDARTRAEADSKQGRNEEALAELESSTRLAQQAIMLVRQGKVIERK